MSGLLASIFSTGDSLKRKVNGLLDDPMGTVAQHIGLLNDKAGEFNRLHSEATQESLSSLRGGGNGMGPKSQQLAGLLADAYNPIGMVKLPFGRIPENADDLAALAGKPWFTPDPSMKKKVMSAAAAERKTAERLDSEARMMFRHQGVVDFASATEKQKRKIMENFNPYTEMVAVPIEEQKKKFIKEVMKIHDAPISSAHKAENINFTAMPLSAFDDGALIYKSPNYNGRQSSEYRIVIGDDGVPAYARKSNHWGRFTTNIREGSEQANKLGLTNDHGDPFGRVGYNVHNWDLIGGDIGKKTSQAGSISLADVLNQYFKAP